MDFIGGALPNVMFLVGIIAFGVGLGLEFKIIEVKNGLSRGGRIGACVMGIVLMAASVALYLRPATPTATSLSAVSAAPGAPVVAPGTAATAADLPTAAPTTAAVPAATAEPSATLAPTATIVPTSTPTEIPLVAAPDLSGLDPKKAKAQLEQLGLQLGEQRDTCADVGSDEAAKVRRGRIACQSVAPGVSTPLQTAIDYALSDEK